jgi:hypothetical protein
MKALSALPTTLQGMYERVLETLETSHCYREALFMLQYVLWARTPPLFPEMIDAIAVRLDESPGFKRENRLFELMDVITQCSSLLSPVRTRSGRQIHLAHSSVKEYLTSRQLAEPFQRLLAEVQARSVIAKTSIRYMIDVANIHHVSIKSSGKSPDDLHEMTRFEVLFVINSPNDLHKIPRPPEVVSLGNNLGKPRFLVSSEDGSVVTIMDNEHFPFLRSASYWAEQAQVVEAADDDIPRLVMQLYREEHLLRGFPQITGRGFIFYTYPSDYEYEEGLYTPDGYRPNPLIHACYWGLELVAQRLLDIDPDLITAGVIDSPLHAACFSGHHSIVKMLLDRGAAIYGCVEASPMTERTIPLHGAARNGHIEIVKTLLQHGAKNVVIGSGYHQTATEAAIYRCHWEVAHILTASYDRFPLYELYAAMCGDTADDAVISLMRDKPIAPDLRDLSKEYQRLLINAIKRKDPIRELWFKSFRCSG